MTLTLLDYPLKCCQFAKCHIGLPSKFHNTWLADCAVKLSLAVPACYCFVTNYHRYMLMHESTAGYLLVKVALHTRKTPLLHISYCWQLGI